MKKRALTLLLALVMCLSLCTPALASTPHYLETDWSEALSSGVPLSTVVELITEKYLLPQTEGLNSVTTNNGTAASDIVKLCRPVETQSIGGVACTKFQMDDFKDYYPECNQLRSISQLGNKFYIEYISRDGQELAFSYDANGLSDCCIYDPGTDRALFFSRYEQIVYENFRNGEAVSSISNNTPQTADVQITSVGTKSNFSSDAEMLSDLKDHFPVITETETFNKRSTAVSGLREVLVYTGRLNYVKLSAAWRSFAASTAVSVVALFLGGPVNVTIAAVILTSLSVGISANSTIMDAVALYGSANYSFVGAKRVSVYDTTVYNDYVIVDSFTGSGRFAGGYNSSGEYQWIVNSQCSVLEKDNNALATSAMSSYDWNVAVNGYCTFTPTGFYSLQNDL